MSKIKRDSRLASQIEDLLGDIVPPPCAEIEAAEDPQGPFERFATSLFSTFPNALRRRREIAVDELPMKTEPVDWYALGHRPVTTAPRPSTFVSYWAGDYYIQDPGSMLALSAIGAETASLEGKIVCDLCAAPGGKATALVEAVGETGFVLANEPIGSRLGSLGFNLARTRSNRYAISCLDPDQLANRIPGSFDVVVVDAPCSGQAMVGRGKQTRSALSARQIQHSAARQQRILDAAIRLTKRDGRLVYSTCTFARRENEDQIDRLIAAGIAEPYPVSRLSKYQSHSGCYRLWPHVHHCAGSFTASLVCTGQAEIPRQPRRIGRSLTEKTPDVCFQSWYQFDAGQHRFWTTASTAIGWPSDAPVWVESVSVSGPEFAHRVGQTWKPSHAGAIRSAADLSAVETIDVDDDLVIQFLAGHPIETAHSGWCCVRWRGRRLGWVKADGKIGKNHLPKSARSPPGLRVS